MQGMASVKRNMFGILRAPRITEKSALLSSVARTVVFEVHPDVNKAEIAAAVEKIFKVEVESVRTVNCLGRGRKVRARQTKAPEWKKAYVKLAEGSSIDVIEGL